jgi:ABC-type branched-subunit amino acid transport system substrate-binding protein
MGATGTRALLVALLLVGACAPRFEGSGEFIPSTQRGESGSVSGELGPELGDSASGDETGAVAVPTQSGGTDRVAVRPSAQQTGQQAIRRGGTVKVGGLFPLSGGLSALGTPAFQAANAHFRWLNSRGGIDGTKIEFIACDDQADDTRSTTCARKLTEQDGVFMMGPSFTPFSLTVIGQLEQAGVPWIGYDGINVEGFRAGNVVTVGAPIETMAHALIPYWYRKVERERGTAPKSIGAVVLQVAPSRTYVREVKDVICPKLGCAITREQNVNFADTEYATICRNMQGARVDTVWIITDPASAVKLLVQCREINYTPPAGWLGQHGIYLDLTLEQSGSIADGTIANGAVLPDTLDHPANREMKQIVTTYYRDATFGYFASLGYASARLVEDVLREAFKEGGELTRASALGAAGRMTRYDCRGLCKDVNLKPPAGTHGGNHNIWMVRADRGRWLNEAGPIDAWQTEAWPRPGRP